jgi:hypothetical protein
MRFFWENFMPVMFESVGLIYTRLTGSWHYMRRVEIIARQNERSTFSEVLGL